MNKIILIGNLVRDTESFSTPSGVSYTKFTIAVNRPFANSNGERVADFFDIVAWRQLGDRCSKYIFKGSKVGITGSFQQNNYQDRNGNKHTSYQVVADEVEFLSQFQKSTETPSNQSSDTKPSARTSSQDKSVSSRSVQNQTLLDGLEPVNPDDLPF